MKFKKILATVGSALLLGASVAGAFAANYPAPFLSEGAVVVVGAKAAPSDIVAATSISDDLNGKLTVSGSVSKIEGESYVIQGSSDKWNLGENATNFRNGRVTKSDLPNLLADGVVRDKQSNERKYTQELVLNESLELKHFSDYDYKREEPTIGIHLNANSKGKILEYVLSFNQPFDASLLETKEITIMGKKYYVLSASNTSVSLLDASNKVIVKEGETQTISTDKKTYTVEISSVSGSGSSAQARLVINGERTEPLSIGSTYKLSDNSYVSVLDIVAAARERDSHQVEVAIGSGKIELENTRDVELNDKDSVRNLMAFIEGDTGNKISKIRLAWVPYDEAFLTTESALTMPVFGNVKLVMTKLNFPAKEEIRVEPNGADKIRLVVPIKDGTYALDLAYSANRSSGNYTGLGKDTYNKLVVGASQIKINESDNEKLAIVSWKSGTEAETYIISARASLDGTTNVATIRNEVTGETVCEKVSAGNACRIGKADVTVSEVNETSGNRYVKLSAPSNSGVVFNKIYTKEGLAITLPNSDSFNTAVGNNSFNLTFQEENKDGKIEDGDTFRVTLELKQVSSSENRTSVKEHNVSTHKVDISGEDRSIAYVNGVLATKLEHKTPSSAANSLIITYNGEEAYAEVVVAASSAVVSESGVKVVKDNEASAIAGKNLIVVGGSCINSVAAELLGGRACGVEFTNRTGVGEGQFLIQSFAREGKVALLVAGYEAADTDNAAKYLVNKGVDTAVGKKYKGTSATEATLVA